jgi:hypothetical protein
LKQKVSPSPSTVRFNGFFNFRFDESLSLS